MRIKRKQWKVDGLSVGSLSSKINIQRDAILKGESFETDFEVFFCMSGSDRIPFIIPTAMPNNIRQLVKRALQQKVSPSDGKITLSFWPKRFVNRSGEIELVIITGYESIDENWWELEHFQYMQNERKAKRRALF